jgi:hypothetical protein
MKFPGFFSGTYGSCQSSSARSFLLTSDRERKEVVAPSTLRKQIKKCHKQSESALRGVTAAGRHTSDDANGDLGECGKSPHYVSSSIIRYNAGWLHSGRGVSEAGVETQGTVIIPSQTASWVNTAAPVFEGGLNRGQLAFRRSPAPDRQLCCNAVPQSRAVFPDRETTLSEGHHRTVPYRTRDAWLAHYWRRPRKRINEDSCRN